MSRKKVCTCLLAKVIGTRQTWVTYAMRVNINQSHQTGYMTEGGQWIHLGIPTMMSGVQRFWTALMIFDATGIPITPTFNRVPCICQHLYHNARFPKGTGDTRDTYWYRCKTLQEFRIAPHEQQPEFVCRKQFQFLRFLHLVHLLSFLVTYFPNNLDDNLD
jgi:hypothetical protein